MTNGKPEIIISRVLGLRPGRPRFGISCGEAALAMVTPAGRGLWAQELNDGRHLIDARGPVPFLPIHNCQFVAADEGREIDL